MHHHHCTTKLYESVMCKILRQQKCIYLIPGADLSLGLCLGIRFSLKTVFKDQERLTFQSTLHIVCSIDQNTIQLTYDDIDVTGGNAC